MPGRRLRLSHTASQRDPASPAVRFAANGERTSADYGHGVGGITLADQNSSILDRKWLEVGGKLGQHHSVQAHEQVHPPEEVDVVGGHSVHA